MRALKLLLVLFLTLLVGVGLSLLLYYGYYLQQYYEVQTDLIVQPGVIGFDAGTDALHFGAISPGGYGVRGINISAGRDARVEVRVTGNASAFVSPERSGFRVRQGEQVRLNFTASVPADAAPGRYEGKVKFYLYRP